MAARVQRVSFVIVLHCVDLPAKVNTLPSILQRIVPLTLLALNIHPSLRGFILAAITTAGLLFRGVEFVTRPFVLPVAVVSSRPTAELHQCSGAQVQRDEFPIGESLDSCHWQKSSVADRRTPFPTMRATTALLLLLVLLAAAAVHAARVGEEQPSGSEIELEEASEIEQAAHHWQFSPLVRLIRAAAPI